MVAALPIISGVAGLVGAGASLILATKKPPAAPKAPTRNEAAEAAIERDRLSRRRGVGANLLLGATGAESSAGKTTLGT